jgi:ankyrin repeat protein
MEEVKKCLSASDVTTTLETLPSTLYEMYDRMILKINKAHHSKAVAAFALLVSARKNEVYLQELAEGAIIDPTANPPFDIRNRLPNPSWILDVLSRFVTRIGDDQRVTLAHFTVQEYLSSCEISTGPCKSFYITPSSAYERVIRSSLVYMNSYFFGTKRWPVWQDVVDFPLLKRASQFLEFGNIDQNNFALDTENMIFEFLSSDSRIQTRSRISNLPDDKPGTVTDESELKKPLLDECNLNAAIAYAASSGLDNIVKRFMARGRTFDSEGHWTGPGIFSALQSKKPSTLKLFIDAGADIEWRNDYGETPLTLTVHLYRRHKNYETIWKMLIDAGADVNVEDWGREPGTVNRTPISNAISMGKTGIVKMLLHTGARPDSSLLRISVLHAYYGEYQRCPYLYGSSGRCHSGQSYYDMHGSRKEYCEIIRMLLDAGAEKEALTDLESQKLQVVLKGSWVMMEASLDSTILTKLDF